MSKLVKAKSLASHNGTKLLVYGPPGTAKTPIISTAPRPVILSAETGRRSMFAFPDNIMAWEANNAAQLNEFLSWATKSGELKNYDTICIDSISQVGEHYLKAANLKTTHGLQAHGFMLEDTKKFFDVFNQMQNKNVYFIAKLSYKELGETSKRVPNFPGNALSAYIPHEVDECYYVDRVYVPGGPLQPVLAWQTFATPDTHARSRNAHIVSPFEQPNLGALFNKIEQGSKL